MNIPMNIPWEQNPEVEQAGDETEVEEIYQE